MFVDVQSYSKRRSQAQVSVIDAFMECLSGALKTTSRKYIEYAQANDVNFQSDIIVLPSGDGAATAFPFEGLHDIHLVLQLSFLKKSKRITTKRIAINSVKMNGVTAITHSIYV